MSKAAFSLAQRHALALLTAWQTYAFLGVAVIALLQSQLAFNAAPLRVSLPCLALGEPVVGLFLGVGVLSDRLRHSPWALAVEALCDDGIRGRVGVAAPASRRWRNAYLGSLPDSSRCAISATLSSSPEATAMTSSYAASFVKVSRRPFRP